MYSEPGTKHKLPHLHAQYQGMKAVISLDGALLDGDLPSRKLHVLLTWIAMRKDELMENWELLTSGKPYRKIEPLR